MTVSDDLDSPWKEAISSAFPEFLAFYFPKAYARIDWGQGYHFLDQELMQVIQDAELGRRWVDKLASVKLENGDER